MSPDCHHRYSNYPSGPSNGAVVVGFLFCCFISFLFLAWCGARIYLSIQYDIACGGHLKRAADANNFALAKQELDTALNYMKEQGWDKGGSTHLFFATPDCDIGFWYENLQSSSYELNNPGSDISALERTNVLMKLRGTIVDDGQTILVTTPPGISVFPNQWPFSLWGWGSYLASLVAWYFWFSIQ